MTPRVFLLHPDASGRGEMEKALIDCKIAEHTVLGKSILGREITAYRIGRGRIEAVYVATHHAMESVCTNLLYAFIHRLSLEKTPYATSLLNLFTVTVIPCLNPDGVELRYHGSGDNPLSARQERMSNGSFEGWQANARGVDLNHNYSEGFYEYKRIEAERGITPGKTLYSGEYPESEPETRSLARYIRMISPSLVLSLHTQGELIYRYPNTGRVIRLADRASRICGYSVSHPDGTALYGGLCDYTGALGIPSLTLEVGRGVNPLPDSAFSSLFARIYPLLLRLPSIL